jgi:hypothetical protein
MKKFLTLSGALFALASMMMPEEPARTADAAGPAVVTAALASVAAAGAAQDGGAAAGAIAAAGERGRLRPAPSSGPLRRQAILRLATAAITAVTIQPRTGIMVAMAAAASSSLGSRARIVAGAGSGSQAAEVGSKPHQLEGC